MNLHILRSIHVLILCGGSGAGGAGVWSAVLLLRLTTEEIPVTFVSTLREGICFGRSGSSCRWPQWLMPFKGCFELWNC